MGVHVRREVPLLAGLDRRKRSCSNVYIGENFGVSFYQWFRLKNLVEDTNAHGIALTEFIPQESLKSVRFSAPARRLLDEPNAGGSSALSEAMSFEVMHKCFGAHLLKTEMEVEYFPEGGSITDYMCSIKGLALAVSVTRAMKYGGADFLVEDAYSLLSKKLAGVLQSSRNSLDDWSKQILHVWCTDRQTASSVILAYTNTIPTALKSNTLVLLTIADSSPELFQNTKR